AAAARMPELQVMELWDRRGGEAAVFRYKAVDRRGVVSWRGTWAPVIHRETLKAWGDVVTSGGRTAHELEVEISGFPREDMKERGFVFKHLELKDRILHRVSVQQVEAQDKVGNGITLEESALEFD